MLEVVDLYAAQGNTLTQVCECRRQHHDGEWGLPGGGLQWVVSDYALTFAGLLMLGADLLGRRRVFIVGVVLFTCASLLCGLAWSDKALIGARSLQGIGAAIMTPTALSIITTLFEEGAERHKALGIWGALGGIGATTAWLIGGPLVDGPGWEWIFFMNIPVGLVALMLSPVLLRESRSTTTERSYDPAGALTITAALVLLVYGPNCNVRRADRRVRLVAQAAADS